MVDAQSQLTSPYAPGKLGALISVRSFFEQRGGVLVSTLALKRSPRAEDDRWPRKNLDHKSNANRLSEESVLAEAEAILSNPDAYLAPVETAAMA